MSPAVAKLGDRFLCSGCVMAYMANLDPRKGPYKKPVPLQNENTENRDARRDSSLGRSGRLSSSDV
jgi:hypothetical protein